MTRSLPLPLPLQLLFLCALAPRGGSGFATTTTHPHPAAVPDHRVLPRDVPRPLFGRSSGGAHEDEEEEEAAAPEEEAEAAAIDVVRRCAYDRSPGSGEVLSALRFLEDNADGDGGRFRRECVEGVFELVFSGAVAGLPLIGRILDGYLPNRETITFDFEAGRMALRVETLPFVPPIDVIGDDLEWDDATGGSLGYRVRRKNTSGAAKAAERSTWKIFYADDGVVAARSSVTGLNVICRI